MVLVLGAVALAGCGGSSSNKADAGADAGSGGRGGASGSGGGAGTRDAGPDTGTTDLRADTATDARSDAAGEAPAPGDVRPESAADVRTDTGAQDGSLDAPADSGGEAGLPGDGAADVPTPVRSCDSDASAPTDAGAPEPYLAVLTGAEEVPPVDTAASGSATLSYDPGTCFLSWTLNHTIAGATEAHILTAGAGEIRAAIFTIDPAMSTTGMVKLDERQEADLRLGHLAMNVHSSVALDGEIRGQILRPGETLWVARLTGAEELPANHSAQSAVISMIVNAVHTSAHYRLVTSLSPTQGHLHVGMAGDPGTQLATFTFVGSSTEADVAITAATFTALDQTQIFANVHSAAFPNGEIRGQLLRPGSKLYVSRMTGAQEVPPVTSAGTGIASVAVDYRSGTVRYAVSTSLAPTMAHIHPGIAGVAGTPILTFSNLGASFAGTGTLTPAQLDALGAGQLYTNIHTSAFPTGEIRGQLLRPGEQLFAAALSGSNEVPPVTSAATGAMQLVLNDAATALRYQSVVAGLGDATSAFMVNGRAGDAGGSPVATLTVVGLNPIGTLPVTATDVTNLMASTYYVDIHSSLHPEGEIRGQVVPR